MSLTTESPVREAQILAALATVEEPELGGSLVSHGMIKDVVVAGDKVSFTVELTTPACPLRERIQSEAAAAVQAIPGVREVEVKMAAKVQARGQIPDRQAIPGVAHVIAVAAGKGGVGKSTVAVNLAVALADMGAKVGLLDADIFGPSVPLMLGVCDQPGAIERENGQISIIPLQAHGVKLISIGLLIDEDKPVLWRGPMITQLLQQFLYQVDWAPLDYLIVDLPPGTGDVPLTLAQNLPVTGALIVTTPQNVATADVIKAMQMFRHEKINIPLLGIVENMAYFVAPDTGKRYDIFGQGGAERLAQQMDIPLLGQIPLGISVREGGDLGTPATLNEAPDAYAKLFRELAQQVAARVSILTAQAQAA